VLAAGRVESRRSGTFTSGEVAGLATYAARDQARRAAGTCAGLMEPLNASA
jgi:hypothetical protein